MALWQSIKQYAIAIMTHNLIQLILLQINRPDGTYAGDIIKYFSGFWRERKGGANNFSVSCKKL